MLPFDLEPRIGYLYCAVSGEISLSSAQSGLREVLSGALRYGQPRILIDCTRITGEWTAADRMAFGTFLANEQHLVTAHFEQPPQIAILASAALMDPGRLTQTVANNRGARMRASDSLLELLSWLGV
jgi:hypothetical protein